MKLAVRRHAVGPFQVVAAVPVREPPAGFLDDDLESRDVPDVDAVIDHQVDRTLGEQGEAVVVAKSTGTIDAAKHVQECFSLPAFWKN